MRGGAVRAWPDHPSIRMTAAIGILFGIDLYVPALSAVAAVLGVLFPSRAT